MSEYANIGGVMMNGRLAMSPSEVVARLNSLARELAEARGQRDEAVGLLRWLTSEVEFVTSEPFGYEFKHCTEADNKIDAFLSRLSASESEGVGDGH